MYTNVTVKMRNMAIMQQQLQADGHYNSEAVYKLTDSASNVT